MSLPYFFVGQLDAKTIVLDEDNSRHMIAVLRMQQGDAILLTDGRGRKAKAAIVDANRKKCRVEILSVETAEKTGKHIAIGISLIKNTARFEWFLEKATEIGVNEIIPLLCERTEKEKFRFDRLQGILISAMLQSQQSWLPALHQPTELKKFIQTTKFSQKFIAHCEPSNRQDLVSQLARQSTSQLMLIGPEGDFTPQEIRAALENDFIPVTLGDTRLRTETAGLVSAILLRQ